jgi:hypothetical protein
MAKPTPGFYSYRSKWLRRFRRFSLALGWASVPECHLNDGRRTPNGFFAVRSEEWASDA